MVSPTRAPCLLAVLSLTALQLSCGGDSSGPGPVATTLEANSSTSFSSPPSGPVADRPSVIVRDGNGDLLAGVPVTFTVTAGGGTVTGGTQTTNSAGVATVGSWVLGSVPGPNTLTASTGNLPPIVFTASSIDPCTVAAPHTLGATTQGNLTTGDCRLIDGTYVDFYETSVPGGTYLFNQASSFDTYLYILNVAGVPVAFNDDIVLGENTNSRIKAILPPGSYILAANSWEPATGAYTLSSATTTPEVTNCEEVFVTKGISTTQSLQPTDCARTRLFDDYIIFLDDARSVTVTMSSSAVDSYLSVVRFGAEGTILADNDNRGDGSNDARLVFTAPQAGLYFIRAGSAGSGSSTGPYTLVLE